jgi:hypothetical protein
VANTGASRDGVSWPSGSDGVGVVDHRPELDPARSAQLTPGVQSRVQGGRARVVGGLVDLPLREQLIEGLVRGRPLRLLAGRTRGDVRV